LSTVNKFQAAYTSGNFIIITEFPKPLYGLHKAAIPSFL